MGMETDTSLTTGTRNARGKKRPKMAGDNSQGPSQQQMKQEAAKQQQQQKLANRQQRQAQNQARKNPQAQKSPGAPSAPTAPSTPAAPTASPTGAPSGMPGTPPDLATQLQPYTTPLPPIIKAYIDKLSGGQINAPNWQTQLAQYSQVAQTEQGRQQAAINESMGSQGSRYSSALLGASQNLGATMAQNQALAASTYQAQAEQQQFNEITTAGGAQLGVNEMAMQNYFQDFLRQTSPPPFVGAGIDLSGGYGLPATVVG